MASVSVAARRSWLETSLVGRCSSWASSATRRNASTAMAFTVVRAAVAMS